MASKFRWLFFGGILAWFFAFFLCLHVGSTADANSEIIWQLRFPRVLMATAIGMGLSIAGALLQALFTNPLCEPYTLGVSSGASLGAVLGAWIGLPLVAGGLTGSAFFGALAFGFILYGISLRSVSTHSALLLAGVMLGFLGSSLVALVMAFSDPNGIQGALFWILGDLSRARTDGSLLSLGLILILSFFAWTQWRSLDALLLGEENALALGVNVPRARRLLLVLSSLLIGICVSGGGMIGFVGLVVPHFCRRMVGSMHRTLLPICGVYGALTLSVADALTRSLAHPYELPVGVMTALLGAPAFLWILLGRREPA